MRSFLRLAGAVVFGCALSGCAAPIIAGLTLNQVTTVASAASTVATGKGLGDYALGAATGKDCRFMEGLLRADRKICEQPGSPATAGDFHGLAGLASTPASTGTSAPSGAVGPMADALAGHANPRRAAKAKTGAVLVARR